MPSPASQSPLRGFLLSIGDELTSGLTVDTNSAWASRQLSGVGVQVIGHATVGDDQPAIENAIRDAAHQAELLVITGGIGPTPDDLTREALANVMGVGVTENAEWLAHMESMFRQRGREMKPGNRKQADIPEGAHLLWNPIGTAAGVRAELRSRISNLKSEALGPACTVFVLPGVPKEMMAMFTDHVLPWAGEQAKQRGGRVIRTRALHTFGVGESDIAARLGDILRRGAFEHAEVGTTASRGIVSVRIYATGRDVNSAIAVLDEIHDQVSRELGDLIFGVDDETLADAVAGCLREHERQPIVSLAESCTGGLIAKLITDIPGSSAHFHRGFVTYSNQAKQQLLGVERELLAEHGAVSEPVVAAMAKGARAKEGHGIALAVSGIAGPGGGSDEKPVGTVCLSLAAPGKNADPDDPYVFTRTWIFPGDRDWVRQRSAYMALSLLRFHLLGYDLNDLPF